MSHPLRISPDSKDISKDFYASPLPWLAARYKVHNSTLPSHIVMFSVLVEVGSEEGVVLSQD